MPVSMSIPWGFYYYCSVVQFEIRDGDNFSNLFIVWDRFSDPDLLFVHVNLNIVLLRSVKKTTVEF